jgi:ornithine cyclodeaminase/alanine dehydrogenase-like protein (mu-crystallin family)
MDTLTPYVEQLLERGETLILADQDVARLLSLPDCIEQQAAAFREVSAGRAPAVPRVRLGVGPGAAGSFMPGWAPGVGGFGCKVLTKYLSNRDRGLPTVLATMILLDPATGFPVACLGATYLTNARTAAAAALAARVLRRADAVTVGVYGSGRVACLSVRALAHVMPVAAVTIYSPTASHREAAARDLAEHLGCPVMAASTAAEPAAADVVVAATTSSRPVLHAAWLRPGATVVSVASRPDIVELPPEALAGNTLVVDSRESALGEAGELLAGLAAGIFGPEVIRAELGEILLGCAGGRTNDDEICLFKSTGLAVQDLVTARAVVETALREGAGLRIPLQDGRTVC